MRNITKTQAIMLVSLLTLGIFAIFSIVYATQYYQTVQVSNELATLSAELKNFESQNVVSENDEEVVFEELTEQTEEEKEELEKVDENSLPYYIKVNYGAQVVNIYGKDADGNYTVPVHAFVCSTGSATPKSGVYRIPNKFSWLLMKGTCYCQYVTQITGNILFHSVPYFKKDKATLEYKLYDQLGTYASAGCVRLTAIDAKWIFDNCPTGTKVEFYRSSNPGPLGKPSAMKISNYPEPYKNWDPTDPDPHNPWKTNPPPEPTPEVVETPVVPEPSPEPSSEPSPSPTPTPTTKPTPTPTAKPEASAKPETTTKPEETVPPTTPEPSTTPKTTTSPEKE